MHQTQRFFDVSAFFDRHQTIFGRHHIAHWLVELDLETDVAVGHDADNGVAIDNRHAGDAVTRRQRFQFSDRRVRCDRNRIGDNAAFEFFDQTHLLGLFVDRQVFMNKTDAAFLCQRDREARLRHGVHRRRDQRYIQLDFACQLRSEISLMRQHLRMGGDEKNIIKGERFTSDS